MIALTRSSAKSIFLNANKGFTLTELMIAAMLTSTVIAIGGWAMASVISQNKASSSRSDRRMELSRALDFMATEVRESTAVNRETQPSAFVPAGTEVDTASVQTVLTLSVGLAKPVIYYVATPAIGNKTWRGPKVAYRWGPTFDNSGLYGSDAATPSAWTHQPLVDALENIPDNPSCPTSWNVSPASNASGFYACVSPTNRIAQLFQKGRVSKVLGATEPYLLETQALARSTNSSITINNGRIVLTNPPTSSPPTAVGVTPSPGSSSLNNVTIQFLGSDLRCGGGGTPMNTKVQINITPPGGASSTDAITLDPTNIPSPLVKTSQPAGTTYDFIGMVPPQNPDNPNNACNAESISGNGFSSMTNSRQVKILRDGDIVPAMAAFGNSQSVKSYLTNYIDSSGQINLPDPQHQSVILFELGTTDTTTSAFDLQDLVLLVTVIPT